MSLCSYIKPILDADLQLGDRLIRKTRRPNYFSDFGKKSVFNYFSFSFPIQAYNGTNTMPTYPMLKAWVVYLQTMANAFKDSLIVHTTLV